MSRTLKPPVSGSSHLYQPQPQSGSQRHHLQAIQHTDVSLILPPLELSNSYSNSGPSHSAYQFTFSSGIPSPPHSESSRMEFFRKEHSPSFQDNGTMAVRAADRRSSSYPSSGSWANSPASQDVLPVPGCSQAQLPPLHFQTPAYQNRQYERSEQPQEYGAPYGSPAMPAPSQLLGSQMLAPSPYMLASRPAPAPSYCQLPRPVNPAFNDYAATQYALHYPFGAAATQNPPPSNYQWQTTPTYNPLPPAHPSWIQQLTPYKPIKPPSTHGVLPKEAWALIFRCLPYQDRLRLRSVNRFFHTSLLDLEARLNRREDPVDFEDKICLVTAAENYRKHWAPGIAAENHTNRGRPRNDKRKELEQAKAGAAAARAAESESDAATRKRKKPPASIGALGCYFCWTVRPGEEFCLKTADDDPRSTVGSDRAPRRYCLQCGIEKGFHGLGRHYERKVGGEIWICECRMINDKGVINCPRCRRMCPLQPVQKQTKGARGDRF